MKSSSYSVGMTKAIQRIVTEKDTAHNYGSGVFEDLLATPTLTALMIEASVLLIDPLLTEGYITIGRTLTVEHLMPTIKGMIVTIESQISHIDRNKISFEIIAYDELGEIGKGCHERYIVKYDTLMEKVKNRCSTLSPTP